MWHMGDSVSDTGGGRPERAAALVSLALDGRALQRAGPEVRADREAVLRAIRRLVSHVITLNIS